MDRSERDLRIYVENGYKIMMALTNICHNTDLTVPNVDSALISLAQIHNFYDNIVTHLLSSVEGMETEIGKPTDDSSKKEKVFRALVLVRRISYILEYLYARKQFSKLTSNLSELYSECLMFDADPSKTSLSKEELEKIREFENIVKYAELLYEREVTAKNTENLMDTDEHELTLYLRTCTSDHGYLQINDIEPRVQIPLQLFSHDVRIDDRPTYERETRRQELTRDRYVFKLMDKDVFDRNVKKVVLSENTSKKESIVDILKRHRWIVLLGEPGSGKTSILHFLTCSSALHRLESIGTIYGQQIVSDRIPIFVRLLLFAKSCLQSQTWSLFDYICALGDTPRIGQTLKNEILKGNCILLLDGLDEVSTFEGRQKVLWCVQDFIEQYALSPAFISPFDDALRSNTLQRFLNGELPSETGGNQIVITSRFIGYDAAPLHGDRIQHYVVLPLTSKEREQFINHWFLHVQKAIDKDLDSREPNRSKTSEVTLLASGLKQELSSKPYLCVLATSPMLLSMLCVWFFNDKASQFPSLRINLYQESVAMLLRSWCLTKRSNISQDIIIWILIDVAIHMHDKEQSGLIDHFVLVRVCTYSLIAWYEKSYPSGSSELLSKKCIENQARDFVRMIDQDAGLLVARGEKIYAFIQMTFQEYFACLRLVDYEAIVENVEQVLHNFMSYIRNPRFRLPLIFGLGWLSIKWIDANFNQLCRQLVLHEDTSQPLPLGAILVLEAYRDCDHKLQEDTLHRALDQFAQIHSMNEWYLHHPDLGNQLCVALEELPTAQSSRWVFTYLQKASPSEIIDFCRLSRRFTDQHYSYGVPQWLDADICRLLSTFIVHDAEENGYEIERLLQFLATNQENSRFTQIHNNSLELQMLRKNISTLNNYVHPLILASILALYGGLTTGTIETGFLYVEEFSHEYIYRDSGLSLPLAEYLNQSDISHEDRIIRLVQACESIIHEFMSDNGSISLPVIDAFTVLLCIKGMHNRKLYEDYKVHRGFQMAISRLKKTLFYIRSQYFLREINNCYHDEEMFITSVYKHARIICETVLQQKILESGISTQNMELNVQEVTYTWMNAMAESLASLVADGDWVQNDDDELVGYPLLIWKLNPEPMTSEKQLDFLAKADPSYNKATVTSDMIYFLSYMIDTNNTVPSRNRRYISEQLMKSIHNRTHIFFQTYEHPFFLIAFVHSHHRALFSCFVNETDQVNIDKFTRQMTFVYLVTESLSDIFYKFRNNTCLFLLLFLLLVPKLKEHCLEGFLQGYFLQLSDDIRTVLKKMLTKDFNTFDWAQTLTAMLDENSIVSTIELEKQSLSKILAEEQLIRSPEREFKIYTACISLVYLSKVHNTHMKGIQHSIITEVRRATLQIDTPFYKIHVLSRCENDFPSLELLNSLSTSAFFLTICRIHSMMPTTYNDACFHCILGRFVELFNGSQDIVVQQAVSETLLEIECFKKHVLTRVNACSWREDILNWSRVFQFPSPILHQSLTNMQDYSLVYGKSGNAVNTLHASLYLTSLSIDAQSLLEEYDGQSVAELSVLDIKKLLKPQDTDDPSLSAIQAQTILNYLKNATTTIDMSKIDMIDVLLQQCPRADEEAYSSLKHWLQFYTDSRLKVFACHAALYLPIDEDGIQISILADLFSDEGYFGIKVRETRFSISNNNQNATSPAKMIERFVEILRSRYHCSDAWFSKRFRIEKVEDLRELFHREQQLILEIHERKQSILPFISFPFFNQELSELFSSEITSVLDNQNIGLLTSQYDRSTYLISLMTNAQNSYGRETFRSVTERAQAFVWQTIVECPKMTLTDHMILYDCIYFYCKQVQLLSEYNLKVLQEMIEIYNFAEVSKIVNVVTEELFVRSKYMTAEPTHKYRMLFEEIQHQQFYHMNQFTEHIIRHQKTLLPVFISDLFRSFTIATYHQISDLSYSSIYKQVAETLCHRNVVEFHMAIRASSPDSESRYKKLLHTLKYRKLLSFYGVLTNQLLELLFIDVLNMEAFEDIDKETIILITNVSDRFVVEQLYEKLKSNSYMKCLLAAKLLVHLAQIGAMSVQEVNDEIGNVIKVSSAKQKRKWFHKSSLECLGHGGLAMELYTMLLQLSPIQTGTSADLSDLIDQSCNDMSVDFGHALAARNSVVCFFDTNVQDSLPFKLDDDDDDDDESDETID